MKHIHHTHSEIEDYIASNNLAVSQCSNDGLTPPALAPADEVKNMLKESDTLWGTALPTYLLISKHEETKPRTLKEAVSQIESSAADDQFLIVAYQDGGLISVSRAALPFHEGADPAEWWYPKY